MNCSVFGCFKKVQAKKLCSMHYQRVKRGLAVGGPDRLIATTDDHDQTFRDGAAGGPACFEWPFGRDGYGYGCTTNNGKKDRAHRVQWERANGRPVPDGHVVRHSCDNQACINPDHLILGTQADNIGDQATHGRKAMGSRKGGAKLTEDAVAKARAKRAEGSSLRELSIEFGVHEGTMAQACRGDTWKHVS